MKRLALLVASAVPLLVADAAPLAAQAGTCSTGNAGRWCVHQDSPGVIGTAQAGDRFGAAIALGDFDHDSRLDLAVGAPGEADGVANNAGVVHVFYGVGLQLTTTGNQAFDQNFSVIDDDGGTETGDQFGAALAAADFDGDGFDDLAIGSPGETVAATTNVCGIDHICQNGGAVHVLFGSASGLTTTGSQLLAKDDVPGVVYEDNSHFGSELTAVDKNHDGQPELVVGMPGEGISQTGYLLTYDYNGFRFVDPTVVGFTGSSGGDHYPSAASAGILGLSVAGRTVGGCADCDFGATDAGAVEISNTAVLVQTDFGSAGAAAGDHFGASLAIGDFDGDSELDLAIGAPNKNHGAGNPSDSGRAYVAYGPIEDGVQDVFDILGEDGVPGQTAAADELFGSALAAGDFDGDGRDDLAVGAPGEFSGGDGAVLSFYGGPSALAGSTRFNEGSVGGTAGDGQAFGSVLAAGDFDGDGIAEVVIGVPDAPVAGANSAGIVYVTRAFDPALLFVDGFEEDGTASWSAVVP
jgi:hypothetical protein